MLIENRGVLSLMEDEKLEIVLVGDVKIFVKGNGLELMDGKLIGFLK